MERPRFAGGLGDKPSERGLGAMLSCRLFVLAILAGLPACTALAAQPEKITFLAGNAEALQLTGYLYRPAGDGPFPAIVALHGCGGLFTRTGRMQKRNVDWAARLTEAGIAVLFPDSFIPRGVPEVCTLKQADRPVVPRGRAMDANGAADWLAAQPFIDKGRLGLIGWSHGGGAALWTVNTGAEPKAAEFRTAIAFYPGCRALLGRTTWKSRLPIKILMGSADDWTPPGPCRELAAKHSIPWSSTRAPITASIRPIHRSACVKDWACPPTDRDAPMSEPTQSRARLPSRMS